MAQLQLLRGAPLAAPVARDAPFARVSSPLAAAVARTADSCRSETPSDPVIVNYVN